jgi:hypothetical protein
MIANHVLSIFIHFCSEPVDEAFIDKPGREHIPNVRGGTINSRSQASCFLK